jgi:hypothetical protein
MKWFLVKFIVLSSFVGLCSAQGVSITGKVSDSTGVGLPGAVVRLAGLALETVTNANGNYALGTGVVNLGSVFAHKAGNSDQPVISSGRVLFTVANDNSPVIINAFDFNGRFVTSLLNERISKGYYSICLDRRNLASGAYALKMTINGSSHTLRYTAAGRGALATGRTAEKAEGAARLEKVLATNDTIKVTKPAYTIAKQAADVSTGTYNFTLHRTSTWNGDTTAFWGDTSKYPKSSKTGGISYIILNRTNGAFPDSKVYWSDQQGGTKVQLSTQSSYMSKSANGRFYVWIAPNDSGSRYFEFSEVNLDLATLTWAGNTTRVDGWRCPYAIRIHCSDGTDKTFGDEYYQFYQPRQTVYDEFKNEVPVEFIPLAQHDFANIYAPHMSPVNYFNTGGTYVNYFSTYMDSVHLVQTGAPAKAATAWDIFACTGTNTMGSSNVYSAAVNRHVGTLPQSVWEADSNYYKKPPCNYFSKWVHRRSLHNLAYGFPYDDVGHHESYINIANVQWVIMAVGW